MKKCQWHFDSNAENKRSASGTSIAKRRINLENKINTANK